MLRSLCFTVVTSTLLYSSLLAQNDMLQSGPMVGYVEMMEVMLWVQTTESADVEAVYWPEDKPKEKHQTELVKTTKKEAFTAHLLADEVVPGTKYIYEIQINGTALQLDYPCTFTTQTLWQYRTDPPNFTMALGSCFHVPDSLYDRPGKPYGQGFHIFNSIKAKNPDGMIWLGDNIYLRDVDFYTRTGIMYRNTHTRSIPELQPFLASTPHYAIWDDHDFGPNNSNRAYIYKETTLEAFKLFWANPSYGLNGGPGITSFFKFNDIDFFLLDNRYFRSPNELQDGNDITLLGEEQFNWLIEALASSKAPFKIVAIGGQVLNTTTKYETYANLKPEERNSLLKRIEQEDIKGVIFITGDRHHTELSHYTNSRGNDIYDFTVSPLTSGAGGNADEPNLLRVENTMVSQRNFGTMEFSGPRTARKLTLRIFDNDGKELWMREIEAPGK